MKSIPKKSTTPWTAYIGFKYNPKTEQPEVHLGGAECRGGNPFLEAAKKVSLVAAIPRIRTSWLNCNSAWLKPEGYHGRPRHWNRGHAQCRIEAFLPPTLRAARRVDQLKTNPEVKFDDVSNLAERDRIDRAERQPLRQADDAVVLDNSL